MRSEHRCKVLGDYAYQIVKIDSTYLIDDLLQVP